MRVTLILADAAQVSEGKLFILGGGWRFTGPEPATMAIAMLIEVPWDQANRRHHFRLQLLDGDGAPAIVGDGELTIEGDFEAGRPPGHPPGVSLAVPMVMNVQAVPLTPGSRYEWRLSIDGESPVDWGLGFNTRPSGPGF